MFFRSVLWNVDISYLYTFKQRYRFTFSDLFDIWWPLILFGVFDDLWLPLTEILASVHIWMYKIMLCIILFLVSYGDCLWPLVIFGDCWWPLVTFDDLWWPLMTFCDLWWPVVIFGSLWWPLVTLYVVIIVFIAKS